MTHLGRQQAGAALVLVLLGILVFVATGAFIILAVDRNTDLRFAFQRNVLGFHSAEAGIHVGAVGVENSMLNFGLPTNCSTGGTSFNINGRIVTYKLSVPPGPPWNGAAGSCAETPANITEAPGTTFAGLNALLYTYDLTSSAKNTLGFVEATVNNQFQAHLIPLFQFAAFYSGDLELLPGPTTVINGRLHSNGDIYLNNDTCGASPGAGLNILGQITVVGSGRPGTAPFNRGRKESSGNWNNVYVSLDGTTSNMQVLGTDAPGSTNCANTAPRQIGASEISTFDAVNPNRLQTGLQNISLPTPSGMLCVPWASGCGATGGTYWQNANLRIALDTTTTLPLTGALCIVSAPCLYPARVLNADGSVNLGLTASLVTFMQTNPGAITYSDVPKTTSSWDCSANSSCETNTYVVPGTTAYAVPFPSAAGCPLGHGPRTTITAANYCNDYRYGGFFNWREKKPVLMLNIDWMAFEEYNRINGNVFFNPNASTNGGLVVFFTVKDTSGTVAAKATNYGVRIYDAGRARRDLTNPGVTFATDQAMYIAGNFNCPQPTWNGSISSPAACGDALWPPTSSSTLQKPTSIVADTINVLSCNWIQAQACGNFNMGQDQWLGSGTYRPLDEASTTQSGTVAASGASCGGNGCQAKETIINAAFLSGTDPTWCSSNTNGNNCGASSYGGGVENYPRFHEDWSGTDGSTGRPRNLWYQGSLVSSGSPNHTCFEYHAQLAATADDPVFTCNATSNQGFWTTQRYSPPPRRWFYDVSFNDASYLPPLTPRFVYLSLVFFTQVFK